MLHGPSYSSPQAFDPELAAMRVLMPEMDLADVADARATERVLADELRTEMAPDIEITDLRCARADGSDLLLRQYRPAGATGRRLAALLFIHGGSFVTGGLHTEDSRCAEYARSVGCTVFAIEYRLAPEHPFPAALDDCDLAVRWIEANAVELQVDRSRLGIGGLSAGGALAAGVCLRFHDMGGPRLALQMLLFPVLDARADSVSSQLFTDTPVLTRSTVLTMWQFYLGPMWAPGCSAPPTYASPAHSMDLSGLPPAYLCSAQFDPLRDEALQFAQRLIEHGVTVDLRHYARAFHSFDSYAATRLAQVAIRDQVEALRAALS